MRWVGAGGRGGARGNVCKPLHTGAVGLYSQGWGSGTKRTFLQELRGFRFCGTHVNGYGVGRGHVWATDGRAQSWGSKQVCHVSEPELALSLQCLLTD